MEDKEVDEKKQANRRALLNAARDLVFERGHDRISVQDITHRAKLATGTYYNYFETKEDIFIAVADSMKAELAEELEQTRMSIHDPAMLFATTLRFYFYQAADNQEWRDFVQFTGLKDLSLQQSAEQLVEDLERGVKAGRFRVDNLHFTGSLIKGMVNHVNDSIAREEVGRQAIEFATRSILTMLGLPAMVTQALTQSSLPPVKITRRQRTVGDVAKIIDYAGRIQGQADQR